MNVPKILLVEDDATSRKIMRMALEKKGFHIDVVETGEEALRKLETDHVDILILDWMLPGMDGIEVCESIRRQRSSSYVYIIIQTSRDEHEDLIHALESGADDFTVKPFKLDEMVARINVGSRVIKLESELRAEHETTRRYASDMENLANERAKQLVHADRMASLGLLSAGLAHEINNPTSFISGNVQTLERFWPFIAKLLDESPASHPDGDTLQFIAEETPRLIQGVKNGAERITRIVSGLKSFARENPPTVTTFDLHEVIENALLLCHNALKYNIEVTKTFTEPTPKPSGDPQQIEQVLINLLINAADAIGSEKQGHITVRTARQGANIVVQVEDNGPGLSETVADQLWNPFFTTKPIGKGTGLGLSISKGIIENNGGSISAKNTVNGGAVFTVKLKTSEKAKPKV